MKTSTLILLTALLLAGCRHLAPRTPSPNADWRILFDGRSLAGWRAAENPQSWRVENGNLVARGNRAHLFYVGTGDNNRFRDFEFKAEVMTEPNSNSGIYLHTRYQETGWPDTGIEIQVNNTYKVDPRRTGSVYGLQDVTSSPVGDNEWWEMHITVTGKRIVVRVNGRIVNQYLEPADTPPNRRLGQGTFALQAHDPGSTVYFRNIRVRRLGVPLGPPSGAHVYEQILYYEPGAGRAALATIEDEVGRAGPADFPAIEARLLAVLRSPIASAACKRFVCRMLHRIGSAESVPVLAELLTSGDFSHPARYALERMPIPEAGAALRHALSTARGDLRIGIVNSIGARRDPRAVPSLARLLEDAPPVTAAAAAKALGKIGSPAALAALEAAETTLPPELEPAVTDGLLRAAEHLAREGNRSQALALYQRLNAPSQRDVVRTAALDGLVRLQGAQSVPVLIRTLAEGDALMQAAAAQYVRDLPGAGVTAAFADQLPRIAGQARVAMISALGSRGDPAAKPAIAAALKSPRREVRMAAAQALGNLGGAGDVEALARAAAAAKGKERDAICRVLGRLSGEEGIEEEMLRGASHPDPGIRAALIRAIRLRRMPGALDAVMRAVRDPDPGVRLEAFDALPDVADASLLPQLLNVLVAVRGAKDRQALQEALIGICLHDQSLGGKPADPIAAALVTATDPDVKAVLLRTLGRLGGKTALWAVSSHLTVDEARVADAALRALCDWPEEAALDRLIGFAEQSLLETHRVLALRAAFRLLAEESTLPALERLELYRRLMSRIRRTDERKLALAGLATVDRPETLDLLSPHLRDPDTRAEAAMAMIQVARAILGVDGARARQAAEEAAAACKLEVVQEEARVLLAMAAGMADYLMDWLTTDPYTDPTTKRENLLGRAFGPEQQPADTIDWRPMPVGNNPAKPWLLDLKHALGGEDRAGYLRTHLYSPETRQALLELGSDDAVKVWLCRRRVHANNVFRGVNPGDDRIAITLYRGWNELLLKVVQGGGDWGACARVVDPDGGPILGVKCKSMLTEDEAREVVRDPPAELVLRWAFEEEQGPVILDSSGHAADGQFGGDPFSAPGVAGQALAFDGMDDEVRAENLALLPTGAEDPWSMNLFVRMDRQPAELTIIGGFGDVVAARPVGCQRYLVKYRDGIHFWGSNVDVNAGVPFDPGRWQMITITYDGELLTVFKDGQAIASSAEQLADAAPIVTLAPLDHWVKGNRFAGQIDEFTVWSGVLTRDQIGRLAQELPEKRSPQG